MADDLAKLLTGTAPPQGGLSELLRRNWAARGQGPIMESNHAAPQPMPQRPTDWAVTSGVAEAISPTMGAYGMGNALGTTYQAAKAGDYSAAAESALPLAAIFAGPGAKTANKVNLMRAQEMHAKGTPREVIHKDTGWFQGPDQKWRFEIDDSGAKVKAGQGTLAQVLEHNALFDAYPALRKMPVDALPESQAAGSYLPRYQNPFSRFVESLTGKPSSRVGLVPSAGKGTVLHEVQHAVDDMEGALGIKDAANPYGVKARGNNELASSSAYTDAPFERVAREVQQRADLTPAQRSEQTPWAQSTPQAAEWPKRNGMSVLPERQAMDDMMMEIVGQPNTAFTEGFKGQQLSPESEKMHNVLLDGARSLAARDPGSVWARYEPTVQAYQDKAQRLGHNGGPPTTEWSDPFLYSLPQEILRKYGFVPPVAATTLPGFLQGQDSNQ